MFKFTTEQIQLISDSLDMAIKSNERGKNSRSPQFAPTYDKIIKQLLELKQILSNPTK